MLKKQKHLALIAALGVTIGAPAFAQTAVEDAPDATVVETPGSDDTLVPSEAVTPEAPVGTAVASDYPTFDQQANDQMIAETLLNQGFSDVKILREGSLMTVTAEREGDDIELVYNLVEGRLIYVNGERLLSEEEATDQTGTKPDAVTDDETPDDGTPDDGSTDDGSTDDGSTDDGSTDDGSTDDGSTDDGSTDDGSTDGGSTDGGSTDGGSSDDSGSSDSGSSDSDSSGDSGDSSGSDSDPS